MKSFLFIVLLLKEYNNTKKVKFQNFSKLLLEIEKNKVSVS